MIDIIGRRVQVKDSLLDSNFKDKTAYYSKGSDGKTRYLVSIFIDGRDVAYIDYVRYKLDSSFTNPIQYVKRRFMNQNCTLQVWTWGAFRVEAEIVLKNETRFTVIHDLSFERQIKKNGFNLVEIDQEEYQNRYLEY